MFKLLNPLPNINPDNIINKVAQTLSTQLKIEINEALQRLKNDRTIATHIATLVLNNLYPSAASLFGKICNNLDIQRKNKIESYRHAISTIIQESMLKDKSFFLSEDNQRVLASNILQYMKNLEQNKQKITSNATVKTKQFINEIKKIIDETILLSQAKDEKEKEKYRKTLKDMNELEIKLNKKTEEFNKQSEEIEKIKKEIKNKDDGLLNCSQQYDNFKKEISNKNKQKMQNKNNNISLKNNEKNSEEKINEEKNISKNADTEQLGDEKSDNFLKSTVWPWVKKGLPIATSFAAGFLTGYFTKPTQKASGFGIYPTGSSGNSSKKDTAEKNSLVTGGAAALSTGFITQKLVDVIDGYISKNNDSLDSSNNKTNTSNEPNELLSITEKRNQLENDKKILEQKIKSIGTNEIESILKYEFEIRGLELETENTSEKIENNKNEIILEKNFFNTQITVQRKEEVINALLLNF